MTIYHNCSIVYCDTRGCSGHVVYPPPRSGNYLYEEQINKNGWTTEMGSCGYNYHYCVECTIRRKAAVEVPAGQPAVKTVTEDGVVIDYTGKNDPGQ